MPYYALFRLMQAESAAHEEEDLELEDAQAYYAELEKSACCHGSQGHL